MSTDLSAEIWNAWRSTRSQSRGISEHREWVAECGFRSVGTCRYGAVCQHAVRFSVAYNSSYEDEEDGWSVVGVSRGDSFGTKLVGRTDRASLGALGRFYDSPCDGPEFRFEMRNDRKIRQQARRKRNEEQQRKGRTARKRSAAAGTSVMRILGDWRVVRVQQSHEVRKKLC